MAWVAGRCPLRGCLYCAKRLLAAWWSAFAAPPCTEPLTKVTNIPVPCTKWWKAAPSRFPIFPHARPVSVSLYPSPPAALTFHPLLPISIGSLRAFNFHNKEIMSSFKIAIIPGDGIGKEVMPEALRALDVLKNRHGLQLELEHFDWACADYWQKHGEMMPPDWFDTLKGFDAILFGAVGWPAVIPDHVSLWGSLLKFRREFDQYINLRPVKLMPGVPCPLAGKKPGDIDFLVVRENTEGEYTNLGGKIFGGTDREMVLQETVFTRHGVDRVIDFAFKQAQRRERKHVTSATKSNGIAISMPYWDERVKEVSKQYPDITWDQYHIDILTARFVLSPERFDVVVASNLFGDILS